MTDFTDMISREILGPGNRVEDANPTPKSLRGIPMPLGGVPPTTPAGARAPTGSPVSTLPKPA